MDDELETHDRDTLTQHCIDLLKNFDSVQIFVTRHDNGSGTTVNATNGRGNWFARLGQVAQWVKVAMNYDGCEVDDDGEEEDGE